MRLSLKQLKVSILIALLCIGSLTLFAQEQLIFAVTLIRHGDRTPTHAIKTDPHKWEIGIGELTPLGMNQENKLGAKLRTRYVDDFELLPIKYKNNEMYVRSTDFNRTIQSAESLLNGLYPLGLGPNLKNGNPALPAAYQPIPIRTLPVPMDNLLLAHDAQINRFNDMCSKYVYITEAWKAVNKNYKNKFAAWSKIFGTKIKNVKDLGAIGDNLNVRERNGVAIPSGISKIDAKLIIYLSDWLQAQQFAPKQIGNYFGNKFLVTLQKNMQKVIDSKQEYKYILYSGHDSSILPVMSALGVPLKLNPPYASHIDFELYKNETEYYVEVRFNGKTVKLPNNTKSQCKFSDFIKIVEASKPKK
ncbi:MAG: histidine phosphatase family protein [bacterium]|nr:histidine phosphatase family protein [bacterium]